MLDSFNYTTGKISFHILIVIVKCNPSCIPDLACFHYYCGKELDSLFCELIHIHYSSMKDCEQFDVKPP